MGKEATTLVGARGGHATTQLRVKVIVAAALAGLRESRGEEEEEREKKRK